MVTGKDQTPPSEEEKETTSVSASRASGLSVEDFEALGLPIPDALDQPQGPVNEVIVEQDNIEQAFSHLTQDQNNEQMTAYERCLRSLLVELKWPGEQRHIMQAMPHFRQMDDLLTFRGVLHQLGFETTVHEIEASALRTRLPCLIIDDEDIPRIGIRISSRGKLVVFDGKLGDLREITLPEGPFRVCTAEPASDIENFSHNSKISWFFNSLRKFNDKIWIVIGLTFVANLLALATPIYTMNVYNRVINSDSYDTLAFMLIAILMTLGFEIYLRSMRGRMIAYIGARFNTQLLIKGFERILSLPISMTESASVSQQTVRLRQFENVQSFFTGPLVGALLDLPFTVVFILAISLIHPLLAGIPVILGIIFGLIAIGSMPVTRRNVTYTGRARQKQQNLLVETVNKRDSIRQLRAEETWASRFDQASQIFNARRFKAQFFDTLMHTLAQSLVMVSGVATLWVGALLVMDNALSVGALIAVMMFVWRILAPIQTAFLSLNRVGQFTETARHADVLMSLPPERQLSDAPTLRRNYKGDIVFDNVSFRYGQKSEPVFRGLNLHIKPNEIVAITGDTASGKSSVLKMILGLYRPQAGNVFLDGLNLQQLDVDEVRTSIGYVAQRTEFFYGTLAQNIRLASPSASNKEVDDALSDAGVWLPHLQLEEGIETRLTGRRLAAMPNALKKCFSLARAYVKRCPIYLLDSPSELLNSFEEQALYDKIEKLRGRATVVIATDDDRLMEHVDRVVYLKNGVVAYDGARDAYFMAKAAAEHQSGSG